MQPILVILRLLVTLAASAVAAAAFAATASAELRGEAIRARSSCSTPAATP